MSHDRAVILAAHGGGNDSDANRTIERLAAAVDSRGTFDTVIPAFHLGDPGFATALDGIRGSDVVVVPLMTSRGYYCDQILPRELARHPDYDPARVRITDPLGAHPRLAEILALRATGLIATHGWPTADTAVVVVGHGTPRHARTRQTAIELAGALAERCCLHSAALFIDDEPALADLATRVTAGHVLVLPFLIGGGAHATIDIARPLADPRLANRRILTDAPLGDIPEIVDLICDLVGASSGRRTAPLRIGTRSSRLAQWQAEQVATRLTREGVPVEIVALDTTGDRDRHTPINALPGSAPFADDIEQALRAGRIDVAVHSLKDLALDDAPGLEVAAVLPRGEATEALVSAGNARLAELPSGATVGTSSTRRTAQIHALRPDLCVVPLRGTIEQRVQQVRAGQLDAAVLATAGLSRLGMLDAISECFSLDDILPAPGQGAIAAQIRADDPDTRRVLAPLDDPTTRRATTAERAAERRGARDAHTTFAACATDDGLLALRVRIVTLDGRDRRDGMATGQDIDTVVAAALAQLDVAAPHHDGSPR